MKTGRDKNYKNGRKNQWRNWAWKEIAKRVDDTKTAKVLYLAGKGDLDRGVAVRHGFHPNNLIALDNDMSVVGRLRDKGVVAIAGDYFDVALADPLFFDVFFVDLCSGISERLMEFCYRVIRENKKSVFLINLQRGRDPFIHTLRECVRCGDEKHRGYLVYLYVASRLLLDYERDGYRFDGSDSGFYHDNVYRAIDKLFRPSFRSYKGAAVWMDSVVFVNYPNFYRIASGCKGLTASMGGAQSKRKLAAAKAIRTMRKSNALARSPRW